MPSGLDFAYDTQGRQVRKGTQIRTFDGANRITAIAGERYAYDGAGRRIVTWAADGKTKVEVYTQNGQLAFAVDSQKGGGDAFITLAGQRIAQDHWNCASNTHTKSYFHSDALGSPVATTDANRNILERSYYAPYGEALNRSIDGPGYTGHIMDAATGLVYAQQRYYDPLVGKFLSIDPVAADPGTGGNFNRYWYANNNPYRFTDPDGRFVHIAIAAAAGALIGGGVEAFREIKAGNGISLGKIGGAAAIGAAVGAVTAAVPVLAAQGALNFGGATATALVSGGNALAAGAAGNLANQALTSDAPLDPGAAIEAGIANTAGLGTGAAISGVAKAVTTTTIPAVAGLPVKSLSGKTFTIGAVPAMEVPDAAAQAVIENGLGAAASLGTEEVMKTR